MPPPPVHRLVLFVGSVLLLGGPALAQPDSLSRQFEQANAAYTQGQYRRAADAYQNILDTGHASAGLYYNLGNAYVRLDQLGQAIRYYEKARLLRPSDPRVEHNLEQARRQANVYPGHLPPRGLAGLVQHWSPLALFVAGWLVLSSGLALAVVGVWLGRDDVERHPLVWGLVLGSLLLVAAALGTSYLQSSRQRTVVVAPNAPLHASPSPDAPADTTLPEGTMLHVQSRRSQWTEVRLSNGTGGWIPAQALGDV